MPIEIDEIANEIDKKINDYFHEYLNTINNEMVDKDLINIVGDDIYNIAKDMIQFAEESLHKKFTKNIIYSIIPYYIMTISFSKFCQYICMTKVERPTIHKTSV